MSAVLASPQASTNPFDLDDDHAYRAWRSRKLADRPGGVADLVVDVADPRALIATERSALLERLSRFNMAVYRSPVLDADPGLPRAIGSALGLHRLDANWLADEDGISRIAVAAAARDDAGAPKGEFIPYTDRAIGWHTDGYYLPSARRIRSMILHCVRPAAQGGENRLLDPELAYIALRDADITHVRALMAPDAMTIPARDDDQGEARAAQAGPVFSVDPVDGQLHLRYTARTRSIIWNDDAPTRAAVAALAACLQGPDVLTLRLAAGSGIVAHNVLHDRSVFVDDPAAPRLLYRARYLDRCCPSTEPPWRIG